MLMSNFEIKVILLSFEPTNPCKLDTDLVRTSRPSIPLFFALLKGGRKKGKFDLNRAIHIHVHDEEIVTNFT